MKIALILFIFISTAFFTLLPFIKTKKKTENETNEVNKANKVHPLTKDRFFLMAVYGFTSLAVSMSIVIGIETYLSNKYVLGISGQSFSNLMEIFKAPLSVLAAGLAISALIAATHRSQEAFFQIQETERKNTFENYIKHRELFEEEVKTILSNNPANISQISYTTKVYNMLFDNSTLSFSPNLKKTNLLKRYEEASSIINEKLNNKSELSDTEFIKLLRIYQSLKTSLNISLINERKIKIKENFYLTISFPPSLSNKEDIIRNIAISIRSVLIITCRLLIFANSELNYFPREKGIRFSPKQKEHLIREVLKIK